MTTKSSRKTRNVRSLHLELVEKRQLMAADMAGPGLLNQPSIEISAQEQLILELVNRARANPLAEATRLGVDLNQGLSSSAISATSKQPLAPNAALNRAASAHSQEMLSKNYFEHTGRDGSTPSDRAQKAGYPAGAAENIAVRSYWAEQIDAAVAESHDMLFRSPGHRQNLMNDQMRDVGIGVGTGNYSFTSGNFPVVMTTENFGRTTETTRSVTGVVYSDKIIDDNFYTIGEGLANITVSAKRSTGESYQSTTGVSGGYSLQLPPGQYILQAYNSTTSELADLGTVTVANTNVKVDATADQFHIVNSGSTPNYDDGGLATSPEVSKFDCNSDGMVSPSDALRVIEHLSEPGASYDPALDINSDSFVSPLDALLVINFLHARSQQRNLSVEPAWQFANKVEVRSHENSFGESVAADDAELKRLSSDAVNTVSGWFKDQLVTEVVSAKSVEWRNAGLDMSSGQSPQVITPGYQIVVRHGTNLFEYRAAKGGTNRYAGYAIASDYLADPGRKCCPWDIDAPCLVAIDEAISALTEQFHNSAI